MLDWLRKRTLDEKQLEKIVDDIEDPADPGNAPVEGIGRSATNVAWAIGIGAVAVVIVVALFVLLAPHLGRPA